MRGALHIALKDLRLRVRDRSAFIWGIVAPLGLAIVFSLLLGDVVGGSSLDATFTVADEDGGPVAAGLVDALMTLDAQGAFTVTTSPDGSTAEGLVTEGEIDAAIVIPAGFTAAVVAGEPATIQVVGYVDSPISTQVARSIALQFAGEVNGVSYAVATYLTAGGTGDPEQIAAAALETPTPLSLETIGASSKELSAATYFAAAMAVFFLFFTVQFGVLGLIEEKEQGTMARLLAAPIGPGSVLMGKVITAFALGALSMAILIVATTWLPFMEAQWGDSVGVAVLVVAGVLSAMGVMLLVAAFARTAESAGSIQSILAFVLGMLGGVFFPVGQSGGILAVATLITPHAWFLRGLGDLNGGGGVVDVLPEAGFMLLFAAVTAAVASLRLGRAVTP